MTDNSSRDIPLIGCKSGKVWGTTQEIFEFNSISAHMIVVKKGGYCSTHIHCHKWNRFCVISGALNVKIEQDDVSKYWDDTVLVKGEILDVPPGVEHTFEAVEDSVAIEFYWVPLGEDIDRQGSVGGMKKKK